MPLLQPGTALIRVNAAGEIVFTIMYAGDSGADLLCIGPDGAVIPDGPHFGNAASVTNIVLYGNGNVAEYEYVGAEGRLLVDYDDPGAGQGVPFGPEGIYAPASGYAHGTVTRALTETPGGAVIDKTYADGNMTAFSFDFESPDGDQFDLHIEALYDAIAGDTTFTLQNAAQNISGQLLENTNINGLIGLDGGAIVSRDGAGLIGLDGGSITFDPDTSALIGLDGGTLIGLDGGTLTGFDHAKLIGLDGGTIAMKSMASLIGLDGGTLVDPSLAAITGDYQVHDGAFLLGGMAPEDLIGLDGGTLIGLDGATLAGNLGASMGRRGLLSVDTFAPRAFTASTPATTDDFTADTGTEGFLHTHDVVDGEIETADDEDWFAVDLVAGGAYTIKVTGTATGGGTLSDPRLRILDANGDPVSGAVDDDGGIGLDARLAFTPATTGRYYIAASAFGAETGSYAVGVERLITQPSWNVDQPPGSTAPFNGTTSEVQHVIQNGVVVAPDPDPDDPENNGWIGYTFENFGSGSGNDILDGNENNTTYGGGWGDDTISTHGGRDLVYDGPGTDSISTGGNQDWVVLEYDNAVDTVDAGDGNDVIYAYYNEGFFDEATQHPAFDIIDGGDGLDTLATAGPLNPNVTGVEYIAWVYGYNDIESISAPAGALDQFVIASREVWDDVNEVVVRNNQFSFSHTTPGKTVLTVAAGVSVDFTDAGGFNQGDDWVDASSATGDVHLYGGAGNDTLIGGAGNDELRGIFYSGGVDGNDTIWGGGGDDQIYGGDGDDELHGGDGEDHINGGRGNDTIYGGRGNDIIFADEGSIDNGNERDIVHGGSGDDTISADIGNHDELYGDDGDDTFYVGINTEDSVTTIIDGGRGIDTLNINSLVGVTFSNIERINSVPEFEAGQLDGIAIVIPEQPDGSPSFRVEMRQITAGVSVFSFEEPADGALNRIMYGSAGADSLDLSAATRRWTINGEAGDDELVGGEGDDTLNGGEGSDELAGGGGDDSIDGGIEAGVDTSIDKARFSGDRSEYNVTDNGDGSWTVADLVNGRDGTDTLWSIETLVFADQEVDISDGGASNAAPTALDLTHTSVAENSAVDTVIGTLSGTDPDFGDTLSFSKIGDPDDKFAVVGNQLRVNGALDFETKQSHSVTVRVTDAGGLFFDRTFTIAVQDLPDTPPPAAPEIVVTGNGHSIADGDNSPASMDHTDFGTAVEGGAGLTRTFTVTNAGTAALATSALTLPAGFSLVEGLSSTIAAGDSDTFTVRLDASSAGLKAGQISFATDDADENPFNFAISGTVSAKPADGPAPVEPGVGSGGGTAGPGSQNHSLGGAGVTLAGTAANLFGDTVSGLGANGSIRFLDSVRSLSDLIISGNEIRLASAGPNSAPLTIEGDVSSGRFFVVTNADGSAADLFFAPYLQDDFLVEGQAVAESAVNGAPHPAALTGDGDRHFTVTLSEKATAAHANALGVYEIDASGNIVDARILFNNVKADASASAVVDGVEAGHRLGFFIVEEGAAEVGDLISFEKVGGGTANVADGANIHFRVGGAAVDAQIFHSFDAGLNPDGMVHARSGADPSDTGVRVGFEDLFGGGDRDFQDIVFRVDIVDSAGDFIL